MKKIISAVAGVFAVFAFAFTVYAATNVIYPGNQQGWAFFDDNGNGGSGSFVNGPATPPLGVGSAELSVSASNQGYALVESAFAGTKLADLTTLSYWTYQDPSNVSNATAIALQFNVDKDVTDTDNSWQGRIVYEPYVNNGGTVPLGTWTKWDALNGGNAKWWLTKSSTVFGGNCPQSNPCTLSQLLTLYPNIGIHPTLGAVIFKAGSGWSSFSGNVDDFTIGINGTDTTYDFEAQAPLISPTNKDECKDNGWQTFNNPVFKNQGDCVSYVQSNPNAIGNKTK